MSKSIYDEALLDLRMNDSMRVAGQHVLTREQYSNVFKALEQAQKQEKLLNKIKEIIDRQDDSYISSIIEKHSTGVKSYVENEEE